MSSSSDLATRPSPNAAYGWGMQPRRVVKRALGQLAHLDRSQHAGVTILTYHRIGGGTPDELDLPVRAFESQLEALLDGGHDVVALDEALDRLDAGDPRPSVVLTFDDGFADVYDHAWPHLRERSVPFTVYVRGKGDYFAKFETLEHGIIANVELYQRFYASAPTANALVSRWAGGGGNAHYRATVRGCF